MAAWLTYAHSCVSRSRFEPRGRRRDLFFSDADSVSFFFLASVSTNSGTRVKPSEFRATWPLQKIREQHRIKEVN
jgi:hypothetical protein